MYVLIAGLEQERCFWNVSSYYDEDVFFFRKADNGEGMTKTDYNTATAVGVYLRHRNDAVYEGYPPGDDQLYNAFHILGRANEFNLTSVAIYHRDNTAEEDIVRTIKSLPHDYYMEINVPALSFPVVDAHNHAHSIYIKELTEYINASASLYSPVCLHVTDGFVTGAAEMLAKSTITVTNGETTLTGGGYPYGDDGQRWRFYLPAYGKWDIRLYYEDEKRYAVKTITVAPQDEYDYSPPSRVIDVEFQHSDLGPEIGREGGLNAYEWWEVAKISEMGLADLYFSVGDTHSVTVNGTVGSTAINGNYYAYILGFNHDITDGEDGPSGITFGTFASGATISASTSTIALTSGSNGNTVTTAGNKYFSLNHEASSAKGGWAGCDARYDILGSTNVAPTNYASTSATVDRVGNNPTGRPSVSNTLLNAMTDVKAHTKPMITYSNADGGTTAASVQQSVDYLPLLSVAEVWGEGSETNPFINNKVKQYEFYANGNSKKKMRHSSSSTTAAWWLRDASSATSFRAISSNSSPTLTAMSGCTVSGIAPKFKI